MKVTVIIPSFKRPADLQRCLEALARQSRAADEILVIARQTDSGTWDAGSRLRPSLPALRLVPVIETGLIAAMNCGLEQAAGDLLVFTDDDAEAQQDWLERIEAAFSDPSVGAVGGRDWLQLPAEPALFEPAPAAKVGILTRYGKLYGNHHRPLPGHRRKVMFLKGVNMAFRRRSLGSYRIDSSLRGAGAQAGNELDLCLHVWQAGFDVLFDDRILVKHYSAPRVEGENRNELAGSTFPDICFNNHYLIAKRFGLCRAAAYFCNERLLGSRSAPGLLACVKWHFKSDRLAWKRFLATARIGAAGFRAGRQARALARVSSANLELDCSSGD